MSNSNKIAEELIQTLKKNQNQAYKIPMENYMKNKFPFLGIKAPERRAFFNLWYNEYKDYLKSDFRTVAETLWKQQEREFHYCAIDLWVKFHKKEMHESDKTLIKNLLITNSWWDSVDLVAKYLLGQYLKTFPENKNEIVSKYSNSENMWLNRSILLYQLDYKESTDFNLLCSLCEKFKHSDEFFIRKAIGWALRAYSETNPKAVWHYVKNANLKPLSQKEAVRKIDLKSLDLQ